MLLSKYIRVKLDGRNYENYKDFSQNSNIGDVIDIDVNVLNKNSKLKVDVSCDYCQVEYQ